MNKTNGVKNLLVGFAGFSLITGSVSASPLFNFGKMFNEVDKRANLSKIREMLKPAHIRDEIIVKFKNDSRPFRVIKIPESKISEKLAEYLKKRDIVEYAEPNYIAHALMRPNDPYYRYQWHLDNEGIGSINLEPAWDISTGQGVVVAVVDTGIAYENNGLYEKAPDFEGTCFVNGYDFVEDDSHPNDDNGHGTHVAGTIAQATNNNLGVAGVAFDACLMPVKALDRRGSGTYADIAEGIRWAADHGARVINLSLGGGADARVLKEAVAYAYSQGVVVVAASGNEGKPEVVYPAAYDGYVIAVGATQYDESLAPYSNYGTSLDLVAPGGNLRLDQNDDGYGDGILQQTFTKRGWRTEWGYYFMQGTSMASPHVAGVAALILANGNAGTPDEVRAALEETAKDLGLVNWDSRFGWGLVDAYAALNWQADGSKPAPNQLPVADAGPDQSVYVNETVVFNGSGSYDPDGSIVKYVWDFGDGSIGEGEVVSHSYAAAGNYRVVLTVEDNQGAIGQDTAEVAVLEEPVLSTMHIGDIVLIADVRSWGRWGSWCRVTAQVPVLDEAGQGVEEADVYGLWSGAYTNDVFASTDSQGIASFRTRWVKGCGEFTFTVNDVSKEGWIYDPTANLESSENITLP